MMPGSGELGSGELAGSKRPGLALRHAAILLTGADVGFSLCRGGSVAPRRQDVEQIAGPVSRREVKAVLV